MTHPKETDTERSVMAAKKHATPFIQAGKPVTVEAEERDELARLGVVFATSEPAPKADEKADDKKGDA